MSNTNPIQRRKRIVWLNVLTVLSAAILISAEVFGAAFAGSWAIANLFALGSLGAQLEARREGAEHEGDERDGQERHPRAPDLEVAQSLDEVLHGSLRPSTGGRVRREAAMRAGAP